MSRELDECQKKVAKLEAALKDAYFRIETGEDLAAPSKKRLTQIMAKVDLKVDAVLADLAAEEEKA